MLTAAEARAISQLLTPKDFSLHKHIEVRIWDAIQNGGTSILYAGEMTKNVLKALASLGYNCTQLICKEKNKTLYRITWR